MTANSTIDGVETDFIKELALTIDETDDDVMVTVSYLVAQGLMEIIVENDEYFLTEIPDMVGSETASTRRSRKSRQMKKEQKMLQCNTDANKMQRRDRERDRDRDRVRERGGEKKQCNTPPPFFLEYIKM